MIALMVRRAAAAFSAAAEAAIDLLGISRVRATRLHYGVTDIVVAEDVTGTDNHQSWQVQSGDT